MASGDVVGFLHSDDLFADRDVLSRVAAAMSDPAVDACYGDLRYVRKDSPDTIVRSWKAGEYAPHKLRRGWMPPHPTLYVRRSMFSSIGEFSGRYRIAADYDWMLRFLGRPRKVSYVSSVQVLMRVGGASNRSIKNIILKSREDYSAMRQNGFAFAGAFVALAGKNFGKIHQFLDRPRSSSSGD
jgi:glycosyltransferase involved in cell wall biosynthesis